MRSARPSFCPLENARRPTLSRPSWRAIGPVVVSALCTSFPTFAAAAWVFRDLGRESEFANAVLDPNPIDTSWVDAARAIIDGELVRAAEIIDRIGHTA